MVDKSTWFVVFCNTSTPRWWNKPLKDGFQHCFVFTEHKGTWVSVETLLWRTEIQLVDHSVYTEHNVNGMLEFFALQDECTILKVEAEYKLHGVPQALPLTCVSVVESILGLRGHSFTPFRLYKRLMRDKMTTLFSKPKIPVQDNSAEIAAAKAREEQANEEKRQQQEELLAGRKSRFARGASLFSQEEDEDVSPFLGIPTKVSLG